MFLPQSILEAIENPVVLKNEYGVVLSCNTSYAKLHQVPIQKILGFTSKDYLSTQVGTLHTQADIDLLNSPEGVVRYPCHESSSRRMITKSIVDSGIDLPRTILTVVSLERGVAYDRLSGEKLLTSREYSVLTLLVKGVTQKQIARDLAISHYTVADYCKSIYLKLGVNSRTEAQLVAITQLGIIP